ncbi:GDSL-type esterase/lipase family protein [Streptomyces bacillaris]
MIGDSLSAGTGDPSPGYQDQGWSDRFAAILRRVHPDLAYLNTAEDGATTEQTIERQLDGALEFAPDLLHLPCGAKDLVRRAPDFGRIERRLRHLCEQASRTGARLTMFPWPAPDPLDTAPEPGPGRPSGGADHARSGPTPWNRTTAGGGGGGGGGAPPPPPPAPPRRPPPPGGGGGGAPRGAPPPPPARSCVQPSDQTRR